MVSSNISQFDSILRPMTRPKYTPLSRNKCSYTVVVLCFLWYRKLSLLYFFVFPKKTYRIFIRPVLIIKNGLNFSSSQIWQFLRQMLNANRSKCKILTLVGGFTTHFFWCLCGFFLWNVIFLWLSPCKPYANFSTHQFANAKISHLPGTKPPIFFGVFAVFFLVGMRFSLCGCLFAKPLPTSPNMHAEVACAKVSHLLGTTLNPISISGCNTKPSISLFVLRLFAKPLPIAL